MRDLRELLVHRPMVVVVLQAVVVYGPSKYRPAAGTNFGLLPKLGQCALSRSIDVCIGAPDPIGRQVFSSTYTGPLLPAGLEIRGPPFNFPRGSSPFSKL